MYSDQSSDTKSADSGTKPLWWAELPKAKFSISGRVIVKDEFTCIFQVAPKWNPNLMC